MRAPHTYFSTEFHGGTRAVRARLSNLFAAPRRRGRLPLLGLVLLVLKLMGITGKISTGIHSLRSPSFPLSGPPSPS